MSPFNRVYRSPGSNMSHLIFGEQALVALCGLARPAVEWRGLGNDTQRSKAARLRLCKRCEAAV